MRAAIPTVLLLALLLSATSIAAQPLLPAGPEVRLDGVPVYSPDGRLLVGSTVREAPGSDALDAVVRFYSVDGSTPLGPEIRVHAGRAGSQALADVAFAADGSFAVLWTHHQAPGTRQVYWRRFGPDGSPLGPEARAHGPIERDHFAGRIAALPGGGWLLTWEAFKEVIEIPHEPIFLYHLVGRRFRADGSPRTPAFQLTPLTFEDANIEDLAVAPDGSAMAVFSYYEGENFYQVGACRIGVDGPLGFVELSPDPAGWEQFPRVEARADGGFAAVWSDTLLGGIALRGFGPDGTSGEPVVLVPAAEFAVGGLSTARLPGDGLLVVWALDLDPGGFTYDQVRGRIFTQGGAPVSGEFRVSFSPPTFGEDVRAAVHPEGSALVGWAGSARRLKTGCTIGDGGAGDLGSLCLQGGRFRVDAHWTANGTRGAGRGVGLTPDTGYLWFFSPSNPELLVKVLDARALNGHYWTFLGAVTDVAYTVAVTDTATGAQKFYRNRAGRQASVADLGAFPEAPGAVVLETAREAAAPAGSQRAEPLFQPRAGCAAGGPTLCLFSGRFEIEVAWQDFAGGAGQGRAFPLSSPEAGAFWFFQESNLELLVKVLDGRPLNGHFWLFYGALSNVGYTLRVLDTETGAIRTYTNPPGRLASFADTAAF
jgi:hypothetical protein